METTDEEQYRWKSCCFLLDQRCIVFTVQTLLGMALIVFCAYMLSTETNCDRATPYWGLIGTIAGFFFNRLSVTHYGVDNNQPNTSASIVNPLSPIPQRRNPLSPIPQRRIQTAISNIPPVEEIV